MSVQRYTVTGPGTFCGMRGAETLSNARWRLGEVVESEGGPDSEGDVWAWRPGDESDAGYIALSSLTFGEVEVRESVKVDDLKTGDRVVVTFEGRIDVDGDLDLGDDGYVERRCFSAAVSLTRAPEPVPVWQPGDVVQHNGRTLLRDDAGDWYGSDGDPEGDAAVSALVRRGAARHILRNGKEVKP